MANIFTCFPEDKKAKTLIGSSPVVLNVSKKILARQSIFRNIDCNITHEIKRGHSFMDEEQIKMSSIYQKMLQRIQKAKTKQQQERKQHEKTMQRMANEIKYLKTSVQQQKVELWQAKNQIMELQELFEQQMEEYRAICEEMRAEEEEEQFDEGQEGFQEDQNENETSQTSSGSYEIQTSKSLEQMSKPSCSIKYFISNRTITSPGMSRENLEVGSGIDFNSHKVSSHNHEQLVQTQSQQPHSEHNLLAFKKSQKIFCQQN